MTVLSNSRASKFFMVFGLAFCCSPVNGADQESAGKKATADFGQFQADALNTGHYVGALPPSSKPREILLFGSQSGNFEALDIRSRKELWSQKGGCRNPLAPGLVQVIEGGFCGSPLVVDGVVYAGATDGRLYATEAVTGKPLWVFMATPAETGGEFGVGGQIHGTAVSSGERLFVGSTHNLFALSRDNGRLVWSKELRMWNSSPAVADGIVYAANVEGQLHALDAASGELLWEGAGTSTPTIAGGSVYVGEKDGHFYRYDAKTGKRKWKTHMGGTIGAAAVSHGLVFVGAYHQFYLTSEKRFRYQFVALGAEDGKTRWVVETQAGFRSSPSIQGDLVFFVDGLGTVRCAHAKGGTIIWKTVLGDGKPSKHNSGSSPIVWNGKLYVGVDNKLWCLNADNGASLWNIESRGRIRTPAVATSI